MTAAATKNPNGDSIAGQIKQHQSTDTDFSDVAHSLTDAHAHRPGLWQQDLKKANDAMHQKGLLPGMDIVGVKGQDLVTKDSSGKTQLVDSTDISSKHTAGIDIYNAKSTDIGGRHATVNPDGSGTVTAGRGDNSPWVLSQALLKEQGVDKPTPNQMANYQMEIEKANGKKVGQIKPGDSIKIPPYSKGGDSTDFAPDRIENQDKKDKAAVDANYDDAKKALDKFAGADTPWYSKTNPPSLSKEDIEKGLAPDSGATPEERKGLEFIKANYDRLQATGNHVWKNGVVFQYNLDNGKNKDEGSTLLDRYGM
jgi:hypothetical protein